MKKITKAILKTYTANTATLAFFDGIFISAAINILTGINSYVGSIKWVALVASIMMTIGSIILLLWQNTASRLQEHYKFWKDEVTIRNNTLDKKAPNQCDWISFIIKCDECKKNNNSQSFDFPRYSISYLVFITVCCYVSLLVSIGLMIWTFI